MDDFVSLSPLSPSPWLLAIAQNAATLGRSYDCANTSVRPALAARAIANEKTLAPDAPVRGVIERFIASLP